MPTESPRSSLMFSAQTRSFGLKVTESSNPIRTPLKSGTSSLNQVRTPQKLPQQRVYTLLPKYNTPVRKPIRNPFNERLLEVFNKPTCSPDFCSSIASPSTEQANKNEFFWTLEDLWRIDPAPIESPQTDLEDNLDEETESLAQEAIERYFQESHSILSPIGSPKVKSLPDRSVTPDIPVTQCLSERAMSTPCTRHDTRRTLKITTATQTSLSFSTDIPDAILELLKPLTNSLDESKIDISNTSSSNLRRKLLFNEQYHSSSESDDEGNKKITSRFLASDWTPDKVQKTVDLFAKSPDISPIAEGILANDNDDYFTVSRRINYDSDATPVRGDHLHEDSHHMSVDFGAESTIDMSMIHQGESQTSDTGYHSSELVLQGSSSQTEERNLDKNLGRSYVGVCDSSDTGITSTPTKKKTNINNLNNK